MVLGIAAEFNPFHNGHKYLIDEAKRQTNADGVIAVMSGAFVQRGGTAITDKWTRAHIALQNGIDLVLELPAAYALNTAQKFAYGAISILAATGITDTLAFGSECGDDAALSSAALSLADEPPLVSERIKKLISGGISFAAARSKAYEGIIPRDILSTPNDILAVEYLRAAAMLGADFNICPIKRYGAAHNGEAYGNIASASHIRDIILSGGTADKYMPASDFPVYDGSLLDISAILKIRTCGAEYLKNINDVSEGLENRFIKAAMSSATIDELCNRVKSKRYAMSRIRRIVYSALIGLTKEYAAMEPSYIRVLGMTERGMELLHKMKSTAKLPIVVKAADYKGDALFNLNNTAEDIFSLAAPLPELKKGGRDIATSPVVAKSTKTTY